MVKLSAFILNTNMGKNPSIRPSNQTSVNKLNIFKRDKSQITLFQLHFPIYIAPVLPRYLSIIVWLFRKRLLLPFVCVCVFLLWWSVLSTWDSEHLVNQLQALDNRCFGSECVLLCVCPSCRRGAFTGGEWLYCGCRSLGCSVCNLLFFLPPLLFPECVWRRQKGRRQKISI